MATAFRPSDCFVVIIDTTFAQERLHRVLVAETHIIFKLNFPRDAPFRACAICANLLELQKNTRLIYMPTFFHPSRIAHRILFAHMPSKPC
jgi:hypothetical protein